jgi:hypothetical protein
MAGMGLAAAGLSKAPALGIGPLLSNAQGATAFLRGDYETAKEQFGLALLESVADWQPERELNALHYSSKRTADFARLIPGRANAQVTVSVSVFEPANPFSRSTVKAVGFNSGFGGLAPKLSARLLDEIRPGETVVFGEGFRLHAERALLSWGASQGLKPIAFGATNSICWICADLGKYMGGLNATKLRSP